MLNIRLEYQKDSTNTKGRIQLRDQDSTVAARLARIKAFISNPVFCCKDFGLQKSSSNLWNHFIHS